MRKLILALLAVALLSGCNPSPAQEDPTPTPAQAAASPTPTADTATPLAQMILQETVPEAKPAVQVSEPSELRLNGSMSWIWETVLPKAKSLANMYSMCVAVAGEDEQGKEAVYVSDVYAISQNPAYVAGEEYPHIGSVTGTKFAVYFIEHNETQWRLMYLPMDSTADEAVLIDKGTGLIPVLSPDENSLVYLVEEDGEYELRVWQKAWDGDIVTDYLATVSLEGPPLEPKRYYQLNEHGITYAIAMDGGYAVVEETLEKEKTLMGIGGQQPCFAQWAGDSLCWMNEDGELFLYRRENQTAWKLGENIRWFRQDAQGSLIVFGGEAGLFAARGLDSGEVGVVPLAQGAWSYIDGSYYALGEGYVCVLRQREGIYQFIGMELFLPSGD